MRELRGWGLPGTSPVQLNKMYPKPFQEPKSRQHNGAQQFPSAKRSLFCIFSGAGYTLLSLQMFEPQNHIYGLHP